VNDHTCTLSLHDALPICFRPPRPEDPMHVHILGICGTFMGGIAALAVRAGFRVTGSDRNVYPPMSTQLEALGIALTEGFDAAQRSEEHRSELQSPDHLVC